MLLLSTSILASCGLLGLAGSIWCFLRYRKLLRDASSRSLAQLNAEVAELTYSFESLRAQHKRLNARVGMREARATLEQQPGDSSSLAEKPLPRAQLREVARARGLIK